jgi:transposase-like protein
MASAEGLRRALQGLSEAAFRERFGTEEACRTALFEMRWREGLACPACGHRGFCKLPTRELFQCNRCKKQVRLTAGTVFQATKLPLTTWFAAIHHLTRSKGGISSIELARRLGVRQPTAWLVKRKRRPTLTALKHRRWLRAARPSRSTAAAARVRGPWSGPRPSARARR